MTRYIIIIGPPGMETVVTVGHHQDTRDHIPSELEMDPGSASFILLSRWWRWWCHRTAGADHKVPSWEGGAEEHGTGEQEQGGHLTPYLDLSTAAAMEI